MICPVCGGSELTVDVRDQQYMYKGHTTIIPLVSGAFCTACKESILNMDESRRAMVLMLAFKRKVDALLV
jgi:HTH-type transcriptional regulator / antitoxin MqsA